MNLDIEFKAELTLDQLKQVISESMERQVGRKVSRVDFKIRDIANDPMDRYSTYGVTGCTVTFEPQKQKVAPGNSLASQIAYVESRSDQWGDR